MIGRSMDSDAMNWHEYIHSDASVLVGKPIIKETRLSVEFLLGLMAEGWTEKQILGSYPQLCPEALQAMFAFAAKCTRDERVYGIGGTAG